MYWKSRCRDEDPATRHRDWLNLLRKTCLAIAFSDASHHGCTNIW